MLLIPADASDLRFKVKPLVVVVVVVVVVTVVVVVVDAVVDTVWAPPPIPGNLNPNPKVKPPNAPFEVVGETNENPEATVEVEASDTEVNSMVLERAVASAVDAEAEPWWLPPPPLAVGAPKVNGKGLWDCLAAEEAELGLLGPGEKTSVYRGPVAAGVTLTETDA